MMTRNLILIGNPNTGKTTLFNSMTKSFEKASNWHGVTVSEKRKAMKIKDKNFNIIDLPGVYSLDGYSNEEKIAVEFLKTHKDDLIINICDANNIKRNLFLTSQLINEGYEIVLLINMNNETKICNYDKLSKELGVEIFSIDARNKKTFNDFYVFLYNYANKPKLQNFKNKIVKYTNIIKNNDIFIKNNKNNNEELDKIILNKLLFPLIFMSIIIMIFYITFGPIGDFVSELINNCFSKTANYIKNIIKTTNLSLFIKDFINFAIIDSLLILTSFLPQIIILMFLFNLVEDIGLMSRFSFMFDGVLRKIGLTGKSLFSLFMGFGCSTSSIITTKNLENKKLQRLTIFAIPYIPCSAKLPVFLVVSSLFFKKYKFIFIFLLYLFSILMAILIMYFINKKDKTTNYFIVEVPKYRLPNMKKITVDIFITIKDFVSKIFKLILFFTIIVWFLQNLSIDFYYLKGERFNESLLYLIASKLTVFFKPIGLDNVGVVVALLLGLCAKELIVVGLYLINAVNLNEGSLIQSLLSSSSVCYFDLKSSIVFLIFVLLYSPCISAIAAVKNELGVKATFSLLFLQTSIAYIVSFIVNLCLSEFNLIFFIFAILILVILFKIMLKFNKRKKICIGDCCACRKF